ncbi:CheR family methyltransferase [Thalassococcus sp. S3]|uniref:CheR family methyltransferase n=1 Tax=Thalassococcus sp. S3 TaxID=2017482 RepID=UPI00102418D7|nr:CheR family methyltransferase [Thalassococcus sp. S3]QBF33036.1 histidine kinase [Thalassococcus sp. S3]
MAKKQARTDRDDVPLVAIGASAGGLEPLEQFFDAVVEEPGIAYVVVQHLSPDYRSMMNELLARRSSLPILHIDDGMQIAANTVYLNRPNMYVELEGDTFRTSSYADGEDLPHLPIDRFFTSLSSRDWNRTVAIVLSGSGSDGSHGAQILHEAGAAVLVQSMQQASFTSMPRAVLLSGSVDRVLDAGDMPAVVQDIFIFGKKNKGPEPQPFGDGIRRILALLEAQHDVDFRNYKPSNVNRRIVRRLHLRGHASLEEYQEILSQSHEAVNELFHDMLIGVTEFYRDREAIRSLRENVLNKLAIDPDTTTPIKVWVPACASGEEVYTLAIELSEALREAGSDRRFRIIGTDIHAGSIEVASRGLYSEEKLARVPEKLRDRYFQESQGAFVIDPSLRQKIIFSKHNLINDPPFMNLDLVSCRNLMIYLEEEPQASAVSMFIFGLLPGGHLFLGASESVGKFKTAFDVIDARWRIFKKEGRASIASQKSVTARKFPVGSAEPIQPRAPSQRKPFHTQVNELRSREMLVRSYDMLLKRYAPSAILLTTDSKVLNWFGAASEFIDTMNNLADWTVQEIVHPDLHFAINVGIEKIRLGQDATQSRIVRVNLADKGACDCTVIVEKLDNAAGDGLILAKVEFVVQRTEGPTGAEGLDVPGIREVEDDGTVLSKRVHTLERDLRLTEETLQHVTERLEASGEELQASNEELQASNEELQASNEELQSSNEELHAVNEELVSVSAEHERKIDMLSELNENTEVVLKILNTGVLVLDDQNCLRRFSSLIERDFLLQEHDINRSIAIIGPRLDFVDLVDLIQVLHDTGEPQIRSGHHEGRSLTVEVRETVVGPAGERSKGAIVLFRWD